MNATDTVHNITDDDSDPQLRSRDRTTVLDLGAVEVPDDEKEMTEEKIGKKAMEEREEMAIAELEPVICALETGDLCSPKTIYIATRGLSPMFTHGLLLSFELCRMTGRSTRRDAALRRIRRVVQDIGDADLLSRESNSNGKIRVWSPGLA
eukprot:TRINITY_DN4285_c0_g1_i1.p1 TRINITY_DN4285_c0_g1~~TRINITY_DN4285_c0_g1_i1.p1  ORF type:complete len:151 (+),score=25.37 TRINITY_DN4285_c0_g1_i1:2177-2629(+)